MISDRVKTALNFVECICQGDLQSLTDALTPDHIFVNLQGERIEGKTAVSAYWRQFLRDHPDYRLFLRRLFTLENGAALVGHVTGENNDLTDEQEFHSQSVIWIAEIVDQKVAGWRQFPDAVESYPALGLVEQNEVYAPAFFAATIARHLDLLPVDSRTNDVRNVRLYYSRLYRHAPPDTMIEICRHLLFDEGYHFVTYELLAYHPGAIEAMTPELVEKFGEGIHDESSAESYARFVAGPAWRAGKLTEGQVRGWLASSNVWWRRAALFFFASLRDPVRMLAFAEAALDDRAEPVTSALLWLLDEIGRRDQQAAADFIAQHGIRLGDRIRNQTR